MGKPKPRPKTIKDKKRGNAYTFLKTIGNKAKMVTKKRNEVQSNLVENGEIIKMIHNDDKGLHKENHPFINSFNGLKDLPSPIYTLDDVQKKLNAGQRIGMTLNQPGQVMVRGEVPNKFKRRTPGKSRKTHKKKKPKRKKKTAEPLTMTLRSRTKSMEPSLTFEAPLKKKLIPVRRHTRVKTGHANVSL